MASDERSIGGFTVDAALTVRTWDDWMAKVTGIPADAARGRPLGELVPDLAERGLLSVVGEVIDDGTVHVLAPTFHRYLIACPPARPARHFQQMQQRVTIGPLRQGDTVIGAMITIEDVTERLDRERDLVSSRGTGTSRGAATDALVAALGQDDWRARREATNEAARTAGREMIGALLAALEQEHHNFAVVSSALKLLSQIDLDVVDPLIAFLDSPDAGLRVQATLGLGEQQDRRAIPALLAALDDGDANVRFHAIEALGKLRASEAIDRLLEVAHSGDFFLSFPALDALARIGDSRIAPLLVPLLDDPMLRSPVVDALGTLGDEATVAPLVNLINHPGAPVEAVVQALVLLHDRTAQRDGEGVNISDLVRRHVKPDGVQTLVAAADAVHGEGLRALAIVLGWLNGEAVERTLARLLGEPSARREVVEALVRFGAGVVNLLIQQLASDSPEARHAAIVALGRIGDRRATPALLDLIARDRQTLVTVAAGALARIGDPNAFEPLLPYLSDEDAAVRQAVISALNSIGHPAMAERIGRLLTDPNPRARESAVKIAGYFGFPPCVQGIFDRCHDEDEGVRRAAIEHLPFVDDARTVATLVEALTHDTPRARAAAAHALGRVEGPAATAALLAALRDDDSWVRYFAARGVGHHRTTDAVGALTRLLEADPAMQVRLAAIEALGEIGTPEAVAALAPLGGGDDDLSLAAIRALGTIAHEDGWPPLEAALESGNPRRQLEAIRAVAQRGGEGAAQLLEWVAAATPELAVMTEAIQALGRLVLRPGTDGGQTPVARLINLTADPVRREASVAALGALPGTSADAVAAGLSDARPDVRCAIVDALGRMRHQNATAWLRRALDDRSPDVRKAAIAALVHLGIHGTESRLATLARSDTDPSVRAAARAALGHAGGGDRAASPNDAA